MSSTAKHPKYTCIRCGYVAPLRAHMYRHLFLRKNTCQPFSNDIALTNEIKETIMKDRIYRIPIVIPGPTTVINTINQIINQHQSIQNFISNLDTSKKVERLMEQRGDACPLAAIMPFEYSIEQHFQKDKTRLERNKEPIILKKRDIHDYYDDVSYCRNNMEYFNVYFDNKINKLAIYDGRKWTPMSINRGIRMITTAMQDYFLNTYECSLLQRLESDNANEFKRSALRENLDEYYEFLASVDAEPYVFDRDNNKILYWPTDERYDNTVSGPDGYTISDRYTERFHKVRGQVTSAHREKIEKQIMSIIRANSTRSIKDLNEHLLKILNSNDEYVQEVKKLLGHDIGQTTVCQMNKNENEQA